MPGSSPGSLRPPGAGATTRVAPTSSLRRPHSIVIAFRDAAPPSRSAIQSMQTYRRAASEPVVAIAVILRLRASCDAGEFAAFRHRNQEHTRSLGNECKLLACLPLAGVAHRFGDRNL